ncbi:hypothetical protein Moror_7428 [Moniliophthora roreri MCA 2997]|uniref:Arrestin C-terminal-like domain-containing protein n=1 Tax=Moniliophthora roreri (strain MCA 2997) TaxID=1381753 RepID=V2XA58_MONRO|nr:hypothetical protein Moror_7428 [Moniliophthora roreri MCA 2997]
MSQVKLTLRPPPNVDFVLGYPGVPPGHDRPQASGSKAIEIRTGPQGVKAKWVRVELRKVETLPGGGLANTFYDFVGPSPVTLWTASDEYGLLRSQDVPFQIRIPESVPPSIALEGKAGIKYELLASVCTKGKRGFLRRRKSSVVSTLAQIIIDKHELHSTWPVYCQPETRQISHEGVTLTVERNHTCYGPGDRISVMATLKSESTHTILLRGFELTLKESTILRAGPFTSGKKTQPQVRVATIDENKVPVNFNLYGGMVQKAELTCSVTPNHTTTTLNTARHIDITYVLSVKALLATGPLVMDLPVVLSNWQRNVSHEAVRRIGPVPSLSLVPPGSGQSVTSRIEPVRPSEAQTHNGVGAASEFNRPSTANTYSGAGDNSNRPDEFGYSYNKSTPPKPEPSTNGRNPSFTTGRTPSASATVTSTNNRFTVTNAEISPDQDSRRTAAPSSGTSSTSKWPTAEEEKSRLYERAVARVEKVQGLTRGSPPPESNAQTADSSTSPNSRGRSGPWPTAEEEKLRLWNQAQEAVNRTQGEAFAVPAAQPDRSAPQSSKPTGSPAQSSTKRSYPSADQEKEALRRYHEAKQAVDRTQNANLYGGEGSSSTPAPSFSPPPANDLPPPFEASAGPVDARTQLAEKERLRRHFEAQDAAANTPPPQNDAPAYSSPGFPGGSASIQTAIQEKEMLRRKFAMQDAAATQAQPKTPPRAASPPHSSSRPTPAPPTAGGSRPLTAAEEKAMLRAKYESENSRSTPPPKLHGYTNGTNGIHTSPTPSPPFTPPTSSPAAPPPLMPRPPAEYIKETQEEDARVSRYVMNGTLPDDHDSIPAMPSPPLKPMSPGRP